MRLIQLLACAGAVFLVPALCDPRAHMSLAERLAAVARDPPKLFRYADPRPLTARREYWRLESELWKLMPAHAWTANPNEADFFVFEHSLFGHYKRDKRSRLQQQYLQRHLHLRLRDIRFRTPYFNRSAGTCVATRFHRACNLNVGGASVFHLVRVRGGTGSCFVSVERSTNIS
jgi:hypothetical protein